MGKTISPEVILVGGGVACASAAIQLVRSGINVLLVSKDLGGTIRNANLIENLVGFPGGIRGEQFVRLVCQQLNQNNIAILRENVIRIAKSNSRFEINTQKTQLRSSYVIIGTGTIPKKLGIEGETHACEQKRLYYEIFDLELEKYNQEFIIIGSGDVAYDYALNLQKTAQSITIVQRSKTPRSLTILQERAKQQNIRILKERTPIKIESDNASTTLYVKSMNEIEAITSQVILVAIGRTPNISFLSSNLLVEYKNPTRMSNLFFVGDVRHGAYRHISIAAGDGVSAAMEIAKRILESA